MELAFIIPALKAPMPKLPERVMEIVFFCVNLFPLTEAKAQGAFFHLRFG